MKIIHEFISLPQKNSETLIGEMTFSHLPKPRWRGPQARFHFGLRSPQGMNASLKGLTCRTCLTNLPPADSASHGKCGCATRQGFQGMGGLHPLIEWDWISIDAMDS